MTPDWRILARVWVLLCIGGGALAVGSAADGIALAPPKKVVVKLNEKHDSGVSGTATLAAVGRDVRVVLRLPAPAGVTFLAHLHTGPCRREPTFGNPRIYASLKNVVRGRSVTTIGRTKLASLRARPFSINVHDSSSYGVVACGDVPRAS